MKKRILSFMMFLCVLTVSLGAHPKLANATDLTERAKYIAFGDSIAAGYGLDGYSSTQKTIPVDSYQALVGNFLNTNPCNYAVTGDDSDDCIRLLDSGAADADLADADVISISIGSNDLLLPFIQIILDFFDVDPDSIDASDFSEKFTMPDIDPSQMLSFYKQLPKLLTELADNTHLHTQAGAFAEKFQRIISTLRTKAPNAEIYVSNIYNPFYFVPILKDLSQSYIEEINRAFSAGAADYTLVDVNTPFSQQELTNVHMDISDLSNVNVDPHPSVKGHKVIADCFIQALKDNHTPKAATLTSVSSGKNDKLTAKIKMPADADGCQIRYATSKNGTYRTLATTSAKTFRTNSAKLKSKKTYYIKARSFRIVKGVTYYGRPSAYKKVKIR